MRTTAADAATAHGRRNSHAGQDMPVQGGWTSFVQALGAKGGIVAAVAAGAIPSNPLGEHPAPPPEQMHQMIHVNTLSCLCSARALPPPPWHTSKPPPKDTSLPPQPPPPPEHWSNLKHTLKVSADGHLLVQLGTLRQTAGATHVVKPEQTGRQQTRRQAGRQQGLQCRVDTGMHCEGLGWG